MSLKVAWDIQYQQSYEITLRSHRNQKERKANKIQKPHFVRKKKDRKEEADGIMVTNLCAVRQWAQLS